MTAGSTESRSFDRNSKEYRELVRGIAGGAILFVGAGSSCRIGYPSWKHVLETLATAAKNATPNRRSDLDKHDKADGLLRANAYRAVLGDAAYHALLQAEFAARTPPHDSFHECLVRVRFRHVLTTNYDSVLESAHLAVFGNSASSFDADQWEYLSRFRQSHTNAAAARQYVHVHGSTQRPSGIVLCRSDYDARYVAETRAREFLKELLTGHRVVFVGFSLDDADLAFILREVAGSLGLSEPRHFILLADTSDNVTLQVDLNGKYHIEPVFFDNVNGDFAQLPVLVSALERDVATELKHQSHDGSILKGQTRNDPRVEEGDPERRTVPLVHAPLPIAPEAGDNPIDHSINGVFVLVQEGLPDRAIERYEAIRRAHEGSLTPKQRYRIDANIGNALYSKGEPDAAASAYLRAVSHYRESRDAQVLEALAYLLRDDRATALPLAERLKEREPQFPRSYWLWIRAQPDSASFDQILAAIPESVLTDPEVSLALSELAARCGLVGEQERHARQAVSSSPDWPDALSSLASALIRAEQATASFDFDRGVVPRSEARVAEAEDLLTRAIKHLPATDPGVRLGALQMNRSVARRLRGDEPGSASDLKEAFRRDPTEPAIAVAFAMEAEGKDDVAAALQALDRIAPDCAQRDQLQFARAWLVLHRREGADLEQGMTQVRDMASRIGTIEPRMRADLARLGLRALSELDRAADGPEFIAGLSPEAFSPLGLTCLKARAALNAGDQAEAQKHALSSAMVFDANATPFERREAAMLLQELGLYAQAVAAWESLLGPTSTAVDTVHLARSAFFAKDWKKALAICERIRAAGRTRRTHLEVEVEILAQSREPDRAISLLQNWLTSHAGDRHARLHLSQLALKAGRSELATFDEELLPQISEVARAGEGVALVYVLRHGPQPERAFEIAYALYRRFPDDRASHHAMVTCVFDHTLPALHIERPVSVGPGTAACIARDGEKPRWVFVENGPAPAISRGEYPESHELVQAIWGKSPGEQFTYLGHGYRLTAVENRALRRVHEIMERFEENFPDQPAVRRFDMPANVPAEAPLEDHLGEMLPELRRHEERRTYITNAYEQGALPLVSYAQLLGRSVFETVLYLAAHPDRGILADNGSGNRWDDMVKLLTARPSLVMDATALAGGLLLELFAKYATLSVRLLVPQSVVDEIRSASLDVAKANLTIGTHNGQPYFYERSLESLAHDVRQYEQTLSFIKDKCEVVGGVATLELAADLREQMSGVVGEASLDAIALARSHKAVLWSDDLGLQVLSADRRLGVQSVCTAAVLAASRSAGLLTAAEYISAIGRLVGYRYFFIRVSAPEMMELIRQADWRTDTRLGKEALGIMMRVALLSRRNRDIVAVAVGLIWQECPSHARAARIILDVMEGIGRQRSGPHLAAFIYRHNRFFAAARWRSLKHFLRSWRGKDGEFRPPRSRRSRGAQ